MKDYRARFLFKSLAALERLVRRLRFLIYEKHRFVIAMTDRPKNNYTDVMLARIKDLTKNKIASDLISPAIYEFDYDRKLFLSYCCSYLGNNPKNYRILDIGGGFGQQAHYVSRVLKFRCDVIEQDQLVAEIRQGGFDKLLGVRFLTYDEFIYGKRRHDSQAYQLVIFQGSLSYIQNPIDYLEAIIRKSHCKFLAISRFPVSDNLTDAILVYDNFGGHQEFIFPKGEIQKWASKYSVRFLEYSSLVRSKANINDIKVDSLNLVIEIGDV